MKHLFISYAEVNDAFNSASNEEVKTFFELMDKVAKKMILNSSFGETHGVSVRA